jgi:hypothetical protein
MSDTEAEGIIKATLPETINTGISIVSPTLPFEIPEKFTSIPQNVINNVSTYLAVVISKGTEGREINVKGVIENAQNLFRDGARYHDKYWMHHCASSIRELTEFLNPDDYNRAFTSIPILGVDPNADRIFTFLVQSRAYLSDVVHFRESAKIGSYDKIYPNQGYGQLRRDDFIKKEDLLFEKLCVHLVYTLDQLFNNYCIGH